MAVGNCSLDRKELSRAPVGASPRLEAHPASTGRSRERYERRRSVDDDGELRRAGYLERSTALRDCLDDDDVLAFRERERVDAHGSGAGTEIADEDWTVRRARERAHDGLGTGHGALRNDAGFPHGVLSDARRRRAGPNGSLDQQFRTGEGHRTSWLTGEFLEALRVVTSAILSKCNKPEVARGALI